MADRFVSEYSVHYEWKQGASAQAPTIVFLHHGLGSIASWKRFPERIAQQTGFGVFAYDRWGYGQSEGRDAFSPGFMEAEVPVLFDLVQSLGMGPVHLVGHSDGASIGSVFAAQFPQLTLSLVAIAPHVLTEEVTRSRIRQLLDEVNEKGIPKWLERLHGSRSGHLLRTWGEVWLSPEHARWSIESFLSRVSCPTLAIQGDADEFGTMLHPERMLSEIPGAQLWEVPGGSHDPHLDRPEEFLERVVSFLQLASAAESTRSSK